VNFREYILKIALTGSIFSPNAPNSLAAGRTRWGAYRPPSWIKGNLLLRGVEGIERKGEKRR